MNMINRRRLLIAGALGMGSLPLRSLITGLPIPFLLGASPRALAASTANFLILSHLSSGDPLNANVPGTYPQDPAITTDPLRFIQHATVAELGAIAEGYQNPSTFNLGTASVKAASSWASLPVDLRQHLAFWHHGTYVNAHGELPTVRRLGGAVKGYDGSGTDELGSLVAEELNADLGTVGKEILAVGGNGVVSQGRNVAVLPPTSLKGIFVSSEVNLDKMIAMRDRFIDKAYSDLKVTGTPAQRKFFDQYAISRQSAGTMGNALGDLLSSVTSDAPIDQAKVAVAFLQLGIAPVISLGLPFGGDNHSDSDLLDEVTETNESVAVIAALWGYLKAAGLQDRVTFATMNTFGRSLRRTSGGGRGHHGDHHAMCVFGPNIKGGVIGGCTPINTSGAVSDMRAAAINSATGGVGGKTDIPFEQTLVSVGKTLAKAVGISEARMNVRIDPEVGKVITGALV